MKALKMVKRTCANCGYTGDGEEFEHAFNLIVFIILLLLGAVPGILYAAFYADSWRCKKCGSTDTYKVFICQHCGHMTPIQG